MSLATILALVTGVGIAAACGLRAFLPLLAVGLAARWGWLELRAGSEWLASDLALWALGTATVLEIAGDKIPVVDHALDAIGTVVRPAAAWVGSLAVLSGWGAPGAQIAAALLGAGTLAVHLVKAKVRLGSTATTLGHANPLLSVGEDAGAAGLIALAILVPVAVLVALLAALAALRYARAHGRSRTTGVR